MMGGNETFKASIASISYSASKEFMVDLPFTTVDIILLRRGDRARALSASGRK
jgi:hypothetical protein